MSIDDKTVQCDAFQDDPYVRCPACQHLFYLADAFERGQGSTVECPNCSIELECVETEISRRWRWEACGYPIVSARS